MNMTREEELDELQELTDLANAVRFNHNKDDFDLKCILNPDRELKKYSTGITQLTLPHRFGLYKTPTKDVPKTTEIELEDPPFFPDSTSSRLARNPNHKVRSIFD